MTRLVSLFPMRHQPGVFEPPEEEMRDVPLNSGMHYTELVQGRGGATPITRRPGL